MALNSDPVVDWRARADGAEHTLVKGKHYTRDETLVRRAAHMWGLRHDLRALTEIGDDEITIRFVPREGKV
jgi:hypothetical protein